jgi:hypothetical protein
VLFIELCLSYVLVAFYIAHVTTIGFPSCLSLSASAALPLQPIREIQYTSRFAPEFNLSFPYQSTGQIDWHAFGSGLVC